MIEIVRDKLHELIEFYDWALTRADNRVADWFLMDSYLPTILLTIGYLVTVRLGMNFMKHRKPFELRITLFIYNLALVVLNLHIFYQVLTTSWKLNYSYTCQPVDYSDNPLSVNMAKALWWYYFSKLIEFLDTIFFILRKKFNQVSFLHVYHHATMFPIWWIGVKWVPGGQSFFGAMINSFIHVIMYTYYGVSALGPQYQKYLWWKKYLTILQLLQFMMGMFYASYSLYIDCDYPRWMQWIALLYGVTIIALFCNFYKQAYHVQTQFIAGMSHSCISLINRCEFPLWMQWALILYGFSIFCLFINFYIRAYKHPKQQKKNQNATNGTVKNGVTTATTNGTELMKNNKKSN